MASPGGAVNLTATDAMTAMTPTAVIRMIAEGEGRGGCVAAQPDT